MHIKTLLQDFYNKPTIDKIVQYINENPKEIKQLMDCFFSKELRICQRAAWAVGDFGVKQPKLILPYLSKMLKCLDNPIHDAIVRNVVRVLQELDIPEKYQGEVYERCFQYIANPQTPVAIRAFSMTVCANIAKQIPELQNELILLIESFMENSLPAFKSRGRKVLNSLRAK